MIFAIRNKMFGDWVRYRLTGSSPRTAPVDVQSRVNAIRRQYGMEEFGPHDQAR
jgi:hypothetical protein